MAPTLAPFRPARGLPLAALLAALALGACAEEKDEVRVFAAASLGAALQELEGAFELAWPDVDVRLHTAGSQLLATQLSEGAPADLFFSADEAQMARVVEAGLVSSPEVVAQSRLVLVVGHSAKEKVRSLEDATKEDVRLVLAGEAVPAGAYARALLSSRGLLEGALIRTVSFEDSVTGVLTKVILGEADAGLVYETNAKVAGSKVVRVPLSGEGLPDVRYLGALTKAGAEKESARAFYDLVRSGDGQRALARHGFAPSPHGASGARAGAPAPSGVPAPALDAPAR